MRRYALANALIDQPNARGSHTIATPRGGGVGIVVAVLLGTLVLGWLDLLAPNLVLALSVGGLAVALIGWIDDHGHVAAQWRALVHLIAAAWALYQLGGLPSLTVGPWQLDLGLFGIPIALLAIVWLTNLYNFMAGIDGLATSQGIFSATAAALLLGLHGAHGMAMLCLLLAAACAGFLYWNRPPAKIFMGDVGSGFLRYCFALKPISSENQGNLPLLVWLLLLALFIADAGYTLIARMLRGEAWHQAHRQHAYQRLIRQGLSHGRVTLGWSLLNLVVILPIAWWAYSQPEYAPVLVIAVYVGLWFGWRTVRNRAGFKPPTQQ
jgi:Fuc2NAc and GlcNAc transferase